MFTTPQTECLQLQPGSACGLFGSCEVTETEVLVDSNIKQNVSLSSCVCDPGWSQTEEMQLYFLTPEELEAGQGMCIHNTLLLSTLYGLAALISLFGIIYQAIKVRKKKQLVRLAPFFLALGLTVGICTVKSALSDTALFGGSIVFTVVTGNLLFFVFLAVGIFVRKYLKYLTTKVPFSNQRSVRKYKFFRKVNVILMGVNLFLFQLLWVSMIIPKQQTVGKVLLRAVFGVVACQTCYTLFMINSILNGVLSDMKKLVALNNRSRASSVITLNVGPKSQTSPALNTVNRVHLQKSRLADVLEQHLIPNTIMLKRMLVIVFGLASLLWAISSFWALGFLCFGHILPCLLIIWSIPNIGAMKANSRQQKVDRKLSNRFSSRFAKLSSVLSRKRRLVSVSKGSKGSKDSNDLYLEGLIKKDIDTSPVAPESVPTGCVDSLRSVELDSTLHLFVSKLESPAELLLKPNIIFEGVEEVNQLLVNNDTEFKGSSKNSLTAYVPSI